MERSYIPVPEMGLARVNVAATSASSTETAVPSGAKVVEIRATEPVYIRWGDTGMSAAAADANAQLFPAGEKAQQVPLNMAVGTPYTYFRVIRAGSADATVQMERIA